MRRERMNNKGFSLVELIIVIAIMAILSAALAPQLMKYIEKSRVSTDDSSCSSIENCVNAALAEEKIYKEVASLGGAGFIIVNITIPEDKTLEASHIVPTKACNTLKTELLSTLASLKTPKQTGKTVYVIEIDTKQNSAAGTTEVGKVAVFTSNKAGSTLTKIKDE